MKAAVMYQPGQLPRYADCAAPRAPQPGEVILTMRAAALKHLDRSQAAGTHYSSPAKASTEAPADPKVLGGDGVGLLPDGTRVYGLGEGGMLAEQALVRRDRLVPVPAALDDATAAALPNAVAGAAMALRFRAHLQAGETVLINGATGFTGRVAVQLARLYGAKKIIATGRNPASLQALRELGADEVISLALPAPELAEQLRALHAATPFDVVIDYLWGASAELLLGVVQGAGGFTHRTRFVSVGSLLGDTVRLSSALLRGTDLQLSGSGLGSWSRAEVGQFFTDILPQAFELAAAGQLRVETTTIPLAAIENAWNLAVPGGQRLVVLL